MSNITQAINPVTRTNEVGFPATRGGEAVPGDETKPAENLFTEEGSTTPEMCKYLLIGGAGQVLVENMDGKILRYPAQEAGDYVIVFARRVITSHTFPVAGLQSTTATNIQWFGGS